MKKRSRKHTTPESKKISTLVREGVPQRQAIAEALSMKRAGRLGPGGEYRRVKKSKRRSLK